MTDFLTGLFCGANLAFTLIIALDALKGRR